MSDVLVIGAGPAGSAAAIHLARAGWSVTLVDRCQFPRRKPCGEYFNPECVRLLRELGVLDSCLARGARTVSALTLNGPRSGAVRIAFSELPAACGEALTLGREVLDTVLVEEARRVGVDVRERVLVREPLVSEGQVTGARGEVDGKGVELKAAVTLGADGIRSRLARKLGLGAGDGGRRKIGITARCDTTGDSRPGLEIGARAGACSGLVVRGEEANLGMVADASRSREIGGNPGRFLWSVLANFPEQARRLSGAPRSVQTVGPLTWRTRRQAVDGCLLLGDAAGFYDPFTGQGVTFALLTAELAARTVDEALIRRDVGRGRLRRYEHERWRALAPRVWVQQAIQAVIQRPDHFERVYRRLRDRPEVARALIGVVADVLPPARVLSPRFLAGLIL